MIYITQPTFLPWVGYFSFLLKCQKVIFLDDVQFAKRSWQQRNRILIDEKIKFITLPIYTKGLYKQKIKDAKIADKDSLNNIFEIIRHNYCKSKFFKETLEQLKEVKKEIKPNDKLSEINIKFIKKLCNLLGIKIEFIKSSDLNIAGHKSEKLIGICKKLNQTKLLNNEGSIEYLRKDKAKFEENKIELEFYKYEPIKYAQKSNTFQGSLSVIDLIFNEGSKSKEVLLKGLKKIDLD